MSNSYVSAISVVDLARELKRHGIISLNDVGNLNRQLIEEVSLLESNEDISHLAETRYPESWLLYLWRCANENVKKPDIGITIGTTISPEAHGLMAHWMLHSDTLESALLTYIEQIHLVNESEQWEVKTKNNKIELIFSYPEEKNYPVCAIERSLISIKSMGEYLCGHPIHLDRVELAFSEPSYAEHMQKRFGCELIFECKQNILVLDENILQRRLPRRSTYLQTIIKKRADRLGLQDNSNSIARKIRKLLTENLEKYAQVERVADELHMSRSTLYRKLKKENTSFSQLLDKERQRVYFRNSSLPANKVYELLGFHDVSAYYKAFKRWQSK